MDLFYSKAVGVMTAKQQESSQEFQIQQEDFPALPSKLYLDFYTFVTYKPKFIYFIQSQNEILHILHCSTLKFSLGFYFCS